MNKRMKQLTAVLLAAVMTISSGPMPVAAAGLEAVPEAVIAEVPEEAAPEEAVPEEAVPEEAVPEEAVPEEAVPEEAVQEETVQEKESPVTMVAEGDDSHVIAGAIETGTTVSADVDAGETVYYSFTPTKTGVYIFESHAGSDTYAELYDGNWQYVTCDDDGGDGSNFRIRFEMEAGATYYLGVRYYSSSDTGTFNVSCSAMTFLGEIAESTETVANLAAGELGYYTFTPEKDSLFTAVTQDGAEVTIYNSSWQYMGNSNKLNAGSTYYVTVEFSDASEAGSVSVTVAGPSVIGELTIPKTSVDLEKGETAYYTLSPEDTGSYSFLVENLENEYVYAKIFDDEWQWIWSDSGYDSVNGRADLEAGKTYYLGLNLENSSGTVNVLCSREVSLGTIKENVETTAAVTYGQTGSFLLTPETAGVYAVFTGENIAAKIYDQDNYTLYDTCNIGDKKYYRLSAGTTYVVTVQPTEPLEGESISVKAAGPPVNGELAIPDMTGTIPAGEYLFYSITADEGQEYLISIDTPEYHNGILYDESWNYKNSISGYDSIGVCEFDRGTTCYLELSAGGDDDEGMAFTVHTEPLVSLGEIKENTETSVDLSSGEAGYYSFTPEKDGYYGIAAGNQAVSNMYDSTWYRMYSYLDIDGREFFWLYAGDTYRALVRRSDASSEGSIPVSVITPPVDGELAVPETTFEVSPDATGVYSFVPSKTQAYAFEIKCGNYTYADVYDEDWNGVKSFYGLNPEAHISLEGGKTYYLHVYQQSDAEADEVAVTCRAEVDLGEIKENTEVSPELAGDQFGWYSFSPEESGRYAVIADSDAEAYIYSSDKGRISGLVIDEEEYCYLKAGTQYLVGVSLRDPAASETVTLKMERPVPDGELTAPGSLEVVLKDQKTYYYRIHAGEDMDAVISTEIELEGDDYDITADLLSAADWNTRVCGDAFKDGGKYALRHSLKSGEDYILRVCCYDKSDEASAAEYSTVITAEAFSSYPVAGALREGVEENAETGSTYSFVPEEDGEYYLNRTYIGNQSVTGEIYDSSFELLSSCSMYDKVPSAEMKAGETYYVRLSCEDYSSYDIVIERYHEPFFLHKFDDIAIEKYESYTVDATASAIGPVYTWKWSSDGYEYEGGPKRWIGGYDYYDNNQLSVTVTDVKGKTITATMMVDVLETEETSVKDETSGLELVFSKREDGKASLIGYRGVLKGNVVIPDEVDGCPVVAIRDRVFIYGEGLTGITIPDTVTKIGDEAFRGTSLKSLDLPDSLETIGDSAFAGNAYITTIDFPASLKSIGSKAFGECIGLRTVSFKKNLSLINYSAFQNSSGLSDVYYDGTEAEWNKNVQIDEGSNSNLLSATFHFKEEMPEEKASGDYRYIVKPDGTAAIIGYTGGAKANIPSKLDGYNVTEISGAAFAENSVTDVTIPDSVTAIGNGAFRNCSALKAVNMPKNLTELGREVFSGCTALAEISLPDSLQVIPEAAFFSCFTLRSVKLPANLTEIGKDAFANDVSLADIDFPQSLAKIGEHAFSYCGALTSVTTPENVKYIEYEAFFGCDKLETLSLTGVEKIQKRAFDGCGKLTSVTFGNALTTIHQGAFCADTAIKDIYFLGTEEEWSKVTIAPDNEPLLTAQVHYVSTVPESITLDRDSITVKKGETAKLTAAVLPETAKNKNVLWSSADETIATVDEQGNIKTLKVGETNITATTEAGGLTAVCKLTVEAPPVSGVKLDKTTLTLKRGESGKITATVEPEDAENKEVEWTSSDKTVAVADTSGRIMTLKVGETTITVKTKDGGFTASCKLTVEAPNVTGVSLNEESASLYEGDTLQLEATVAPEDAGDKAMTWTSSDATVATVDENGLVTAVSEGSADITVTTDDGGFTAVCKVEIAKKISFKDVADENLWYYDSVYWAVRNNVTSGMGEGTFQPMAKLSRAQAVTFLYNLAGRPDVSGLEAKEFTDVSNTAWYYNAVKWAVSNKITSGYGTGTFQPNATCNRAMIVTFLANYAKAAGTYKDPTTSASFKDVKATDWFRKSVDWAVENGITSGYGQGTFSPNVTCNRAMMVTFLKKVAELPAA